MSNKQQQQKNCLRLLFKRAILDKQVAEDSYIKKNFKIS